MRAHLICVGVAALLTACADDGGGARDETLDGALAADLRLPDSMVETDAAIPGSWVNIKAGSFTMGSPASESCRDADETARAVTLTRAFVMAATEVTQGQYRKLMGKNPAFHSACGDACPVDWVSWHEAAAYCNALSALKGVAGCYQCSGAAGQTRCQPSGKPGSCAGYRLPSEAEWEYAARAGTKTPFHNGGISSCMTTDAGAGAIAWYKVNASGLPHAVKGKAANAWGLFDMSGNVYEWTADWYRASPGSAAATDPTGPASGTERVFRGGAWYFNAEHARSANRERYSPDKRFTFLGFRCVRTASLGGGK